MELNTHATQLGRATDDDDVTVSLDMLDEWRRHRTLAWIDWKRDGKVPGPGAQISWGDVKNADDPDSADYIEIPLAGWGEYTDHALWERANYDYLVENYVEEVVRVGYSGHDGQALYVRVGSEISASLAEYVDWPDYPIIDDDTYYALCEEIERETVREHLLADFANDQFDADDLWPAYCSLREDGVLAFEHEGTTSGYLTAPSGPTAREERDAYIGKKLHTRARQLARQAGA